MQKLYEPSLAYDTDDWSLFHSKKLLTLLGPIWKSKPNNVGASKSYIKVW